MHVLVKTLIFYGIAFSAIRMLVGSYSSLYLLSKGLPIEGLAMLKGMQAGIILCLSIPFSYLSDKCGRERVIRSSILCSAIWLGITAYAPNVGCLYLGEVFNAISLALFNGPFEALLIDIFQKYHPSGKISEVLGMYSKYTFIFMAIAAILGGGFAVSIESSLFWWIAFFVLLLLFTSSFKFLKRHEIIYQRNLCKSIFSKDEFFDHLKATINIILKNKCHLIPFLGLAILINLYYQVILQYWQPMASDLMGNLKGTLPYTILFVLILLAQSASGKSVVLVKNIKNLLFVLILALAITSLGVVLSLNVASFSGLSMIVLSFFVIKLIQIIVSEKINEFIPSNQRATFISSISTIMRLFLFPLLFIVGSLVSIIGLRVIPTLGVLLIFSIPILWTISIANKTEKVNI